MKKTLSLFLAAVLLLSFYACGKEDTASTLESDINLGIVDEIALLDDTRQVLSSAVLGDTAFLVTAMNDNSTILLQINLETGETESREVEIDTSGRVILFTYLDEIRLVSGNVMQTMGADLSLSEGKDLTRIFDGAMILSAKSDSQGNIYFIANDKVIVTDGDYSQKSEVSSSVRRYRSIAISGEGEIYVAFLKNLGDSLNLEALGGNDSVGISGTIINGDENFVLYLYDGEGMFGLNPETGDVLQFLDWLPNGVVSSDISAVHTLTGNRFAVVTSEKVIILGEVDDSSVTKKEQLELTLACLNPDGILPQEVAKFNSSNPDYYITMTDYWDYTVDDGLTAGLYRLNLEIIAGKIPDIFYMGGIINLPIDAYIRQDIFADLYPFLDSDPEISRGDFFETVLAACEKDGKLQFLPEFFAVSMLGGRASVIGTEGMTIEDIIAFAEKNSENLINMANFSNSDFLQAVIEYGGDSLIDWETGECYFESEGFIRILEASKLFGYSMFSPSNPPPSDYEPPIWDLTLHTVYNMLNYMGNTSQYGDDFACFGFPTTGEPAVACSPAATLAISSACENTEGAWEFVRQFYMADTQVSHALATGRSCLPSNRIAFNEIMAYEIANPDSYINIFGFNAPTEEDVKAIEDVINSINVLENSKNEITTIVIDAAAAYFAGDKTAEEVASIIQSRVKILVAEQS